MDRTPMSVAALVALFCLTIERTDAQTAQDLAIEAQMMRDLVGTWTLVSVVAQQQGGTKVETLGANPIGTLVFGSDGHYALIFLRRDLPTIASKNRLSQTPAESQAIATGTIAHFGTYIVLAGSKTLVLQIESSTFPNWNGVEQWRPFSLSADELTYNVSTGATGLPAHVTLRRANTSGP
jgi:hypothetical protein